MSHVSSMALPNTSQVPPDLRARIESALAGTLGNRRVRRIEWRPGPHRSSYWIDEIDLELEDGTVLALVAKATNWDSMCPEGRSAKPRFLYDADRELTTYESILSTLDINAARYYGSMNAAPGDRRLLLERSEGVPLWQLDKYDAWRSAASWLARMHARALVATIHTSIAGRHLVRYDEGFYRCWMRRALEFSCDRREALTALAKGHTRVVEWLLAQPIGFIHGDFYSSNILVERNGGLLAVRPIDWEMAGLGPHLMDLASLLSGLWTDEERSDIAQTYHQTLASEGVATPTPETYLKTLDCCLIQLAVQNLGWSASWTPPPEHAHDWLGEALRVCAKWHL